MNFAKDIRRLAKCSLTSKDKLLRATLKMEKEQLVEAIFQSGL